MPASGVDFTPTFRHAGFASEPVNRLASTAQLWVVGVGLAGGLAAAAAEPQPLVRAHAHNDYEHARPLFDALDHGFCSVEADIWLVDGQLLVAHDRDAVKPERTLEALYLDPLRERIRRNGGRVYPSGPPFTLLVDVKSGAGETYRALRAVLQGYTNILTAFTPSRIVTNAVTIVLSGNRTPDLLEAEVLRHAALDGRLPDLAGRASSRLFPLVSDNWALHFRWRGGSPLDDEERQKLRRWVDQAHQQGRRIRFWEAPDTREGWRELYQAGVDLLNTDDLSGLADWLREQEPREER
jgi:hypothetical protein